MQKDERDLLEVLKFELKFLEDGGKPPSVSVSGIFVTISNPSKQNNLNGIVVGQADSFVPALATPPIKVSIGD